tara:strand:+ start:1221 stop:1613 length:393 start_codon:yes stop_codon:yes gene_type:complete
MATVTRVNGSGLTVAGNVHSPGAFAFKILVKDTSAAAIDLRAEDDAIDEAVEAIVKEINPFIYHTTDDNSGTITVVCSNSATAADLQHRIRTIAGDWDRDTNAYSVSTVGPNNIDASGTLVTAAATLVAT